MKRPGKGLSIAAAILVVAGITALFLRPGSPTPDAGGGRVAEHLVPAPPADRPAEVAPEGGPVRAVEASSASSRADRLEAEAADAAEGRANRQRLLYRNLTELDAAAARAERAGDPAYAAALRRRAEILAQSVRPE